MSRLTQIAPDTARTGKTRELLDAVKGRLGLVPNMTRAMANFPAALDGYLQLGGARPGAPCRPRSREQIALAVAQANGCDYCLAAHSAVGRMVGPDRRPDPRQPARHRRGPEGRRLDPVRPQGGGYPRPVSDGDLDEVRAGRLRRRGDRRGGRQRAQSTSSPTTSTGRRDRPRLPGG